MVNQKLIDFVAKYRSFSLTNDMNLINIFQELSQEFPDNLPLDYDQILTEVKSYLEKLGYNSDNLLLSKQNLKYDIKQNDYSWPIYHNQFNFKHTDTKTNNLTPFDSITFDKKTMELRFAKAYQKACFDQMIDQDRQILIDLLAKFNREMPLLERKTASKKDIEDGYSQVTQFYLLMPLDEQLLNLLVLLVLADKQESILDNKILEYSAKLIYVQQSSISIKTKESTNLKRVMYDFGKDTNEFLKTFRIPDSDQDDEVALPDIKVLQLIKYMSDVLNDRPVDPEMFNLIASGTTNLSDSSYQIIMNQAHQLQLTDILSKASRIEIGKIKKDLSSDVARKIKHVWKINDQDTNDPDNDLNHKTLVHGTENLSVLNILGEGLLDSVSLAKEKSKHYHYTGNGLGRGIYFARMDQADKSYNYTEYRRREGISAYMFVVDVAYHKAKIVDEYNTGLSTSKNQDLVWAKGVGSYDRDEFVAKHPKQVQLKYLLELE